MKKLVKIQSELKAPKNQYNAFGKYKYRNCEDILEALKPLLKKHECTLSISDEIKTAGAVMYVESTCTLIEQEGETTIVSAQAGIDINRKGMDVAQCFGASSSYARKYALNGMFLIDDTAASPPGNDPDSLPPVTKPKAKTTVSDDQFSAIVDRYLKGEHGVFDKASQAMQFTSAQSVEISEIINNK